MYSPFQFQTRKTLPAQVHRGATMLQFRAHADPAREPNSLHVDLSK